MYQKYLSQLNVEDCGAVVAAPDDVSFNFLFALTKIREMKKTGKLFLSAVKLPLIPFI
jgi:hypothetical protein